MTRVAAYAEPRFAPLPPKATPGQTAPPAQRTRHHGPVRRHGDPLDRALGTPRHAAVVAPLIWQEAS